MDDDLWAGIEFKLGESQFFLDRMGKVLVPPRPTHPAMMEHTVAKWQPDFYYYLDAFLAAARSVPDVIQKCFGWDERSGRDWPLPPDAEEIERRKRFQTEFTSLYWSFLRLPLSRVRTGTFHWIGLPSVQTKAKVFCGPEFTGGPRQRIPDNAVRELAAGEDPALAFLNKPMPVQPSWQDFTLEIPHEDDSSRSMPLFDECRTYLRAAEELVENAKELGARVHGGRKLTVPPAVAAEKR